VIIKIFLITIDEVNAMAEDSKTSNALLNATGIPLHTIDDPEVARLVVHHNTVVASHMLPGLHLNVKQLKQGIQAEIILEQGIEIKKPVHLCFGMLPETGIQKIDLDVRIKKQAKVAILAHCVFPNAVSIEHIMNAEIHVGEGAEYSYFERHIHSPHGGIKVYPTAVIELEPRSRFKTEFELLKGRVGEILVDYQTTCREKSVMEMMARISGIGNDKIKIKETGYLVGKGARGVLTSRIAVRNQAIAEVYNKLRASASHARGHVDCKEIVQDQGIATAIPIVEVNHPKAHITHEAAIGSVDNKQLETLMSRGLSEDEAVELIIQGLLS